MSKDIKIDEATLEELSVIFTWAQVTIDTQYDSRTTKDMQNLIVSVAQKIGLFANETKMANLVRQSFSSENIVKYHTIDTLLEMLDDDTLSHFFNLCLIHKKHYND